DELEKQIVGTFGGEVVGPSVHHGGVTEIG
ncbi:hypothetical protein A2U01_0078498, partial [Trifolium medium]|nr:hypothetical protein [Trifolium medium]